MAAPANDAPQITLTVEERIIVWLVSNLTDLDLVKQ